MKRGRDDAGSAAMAMPTDPQLPAKILKASPVPSLAGRPPPALAAVKVSPSRPLTPQASKPTTPRFKPLPPQPGVRGPVDVFGQTHPAKATDVVLCLNCGRNVAAGTFAPHLEKCLGKGRAAARAAARKIQGQSQM
jgi:hypothetical protein